MAAPCSVREVDTETGQPSLERLSDMIGGVAEGAEAELADKICCVLNKADASGKLLGSDTAENAGLFAQRSTTLVLKGASSQCSHLQHALSRFFLAVAEAGDKLPMTAILVLGGALLALRQGSAQALPADIMLGLHFVQTWMAGEALEAVVEALVKRSHIFPSEVAQAASAWLCGLQDYLAVACAKVLHVSTARDFTDWLESSYVRRLAEAHRTAMCLDISDHLESNTYCWELLGRISLRGNATPLACAFCDAAFRSLDVATKLGKSVSKLSEQNPSASRMLVCAILVQAGYVFFKSDVRLLAQRDDAVACFSALLHPSLGAGRPIQQLLAIQLWQTRRGSELTSPTVFALVDAMHAAGLSCWLPAYSHWLQTWADPSHFQASDLAAERNLALRLARAALVHIPEQDPKPGETSRLLLRGVHLRLSAQTKERRLFGMSVAELLAERWSGGADGQPQLRFDHFDRRVISSHAKT